MRGGQRVTVVAAAVNPCVCMCVRNLNPYVLLLFLLFVLLLLFLLISFLVVEFALVICIYISFVVVVVCLVAPVIQLLFVCF